MKHRLYLRLAHSYKSLILQTSFASKSYSEATLPIILGEAVSLTGVMHRNMGEGLPTEAQQLTGGSTN